MRNKTFLWVYSFCFLVIPLFLVFRAFFATGSLAWGDAPFFTSEGMRELMAENYIWTSRGNTLGGVNQLLWIYPIMFVWGALHTVLGFPNDLIIRVLFYFPSLILATVSAFLFAKSLKLSSKAAILGAIVYIFNTYYLLLVDGGQVGVALAYGFFPLSLLTLLNLFKSPTSKFFWIALIANFIFSVIDPRFLIVSVVTLILWVSVGFIAKREFAVSKKVILKFLFLGLALVFLNSYWLIPTVFSSVASLTIPVSSLQLVSLLNTLLLHQPHWPGNVFGETIAPPFYFALTPVLIFIGVLYKKNKAFLALALLFLLMAFLAKGDTPPLGQIYSFVVTGIPFGVVLRDATKFYVPLLLLGATLVAYTGEVFSKKWGNKILAVLGVFVLILIQPALFGKLNFVLSSRQNTDITFVNTLIKEDNAIFRTAWFPERYPLSIHTNQKQAIDAKDLVALLPLSSLNVGDYDKFNYTHQENFLEWYRLFGIKYLVMSGDPRKVAYTKEDQQNWDDLTNRIATVSGLLRENKLTIPTYKVSDVRSRALAAPQAVVVVGGTTHISPKVPMFFAEDGKFDVLALENISSGSAALFFDGKTEEDLRMSLLKENFQGPARARTSQWARWSKVDSLKWRYEALIRGVDTKELDYDLGIASSEVSGEEITYNIDTPTSGNFMLAIRVLGKSSDDELRIKLNDQEWTASVQGSDFEWLIKEVNLSQGKNTLTITNSKGFWLLNAVSLFSDTKWKDATRKVTSYLSTFPTITNPQLADRVGEDTWVDLEYENPNPVTYKFSVPANLSWVMISESFNPGWRTKDKKTSLPIYSVANGYYVKNVPAELSISFVEQDYSRWGLYFSGLTVLILGAIGIYLRK